MKRIFLLSIILISSYTFSYSQDSLKQIVKKDNSNGIVEKFYVLKKNKKVKHGSYEKLMNGKLIEKGQYSSDKKIGIWKFYGFKDKLELEYNFDENEVVFYDRDQTVDTLDRPIIFLGSYNIPRRLIQMKLKYPIAAMENGISGKVVISIFIDETGKIFDYQVKEKVDPSLDVEALRVAKLIQGEWLPAIYKGKKIKTSFDFPIVFQLQ